VAQQKQRSPGALTVCSWSFVWSFEPPSRPAGPGAMLSAFARWGAARQVENDLVEEGQLSSDWESDSDAQPAERQCRPWRSPAVLTLAFLVGACALRFVSQAGRRSWEQRSGRRGLLGPVVGRAGDMYACFMESGAGFSPDMEDHPAATETSPEACQQRCVEADGCAHFTYSKGWCHLQALDAEKSTWPLDAVSGPAAWPVDCRNMSRLMRRVFSFGAPATSYPALSNPGGECIPGLRIYAENSALPGGGVGKQIDAASMWVTQFPHAKTPVLVLAGDGKLSRYKKCPGEPLWPLPGAAKYQDWTLHFAYWGRMQHPVNVPGYTEQELQVPLARTMLNLTGFTYDHNLEEVRKDIRKVPGYRLVGYAKQEGLGGDIDRVLLVQDVASQDCVIAFEGSQSVEDIDLFAHAEPTGFCGFKSTHTGVRNELWSIISSKPYQRLKPHLELCASVDCTGHSLGGSLCELYTACANSGRIEDPDFRLLAWIPRSSGAEVMEEV